MPGGRKPRQIETLQQLIDWAGGKKEFTERTGVQTGDINHYLNQNKKFSNRLLKKWAFEVCANPPRIIPLAEHLELPTTGPLPVQLAGKSGLYSLFDSAGRLLYFGMATNLRTEIAQTLGRNAPKFYVGNGHQVWTFKDISVFYSAYEVLGGDQKFRRTLEALVLRTVINDTHNQRVGSMT